MPQNTQNHARILWLLTALFALRVAGQAVQRWAPLPFLPAFQDFQGSHLPYWLLLTAQIVILAIMVRGARRVGHAWAPQKRLGRVLAWIGGIYFLASLARILIGWTTPGASPWFRAWISEAFHLVLAGYLLTLAAYHLQWPRR